MVKNGERAETPPLFLFEMKTKARMRMVLNLDGAPATKAPRISIIPHSPKKINRQNDQKFNSICSQNCTKRRKSRKYKNN